MISEHINEMGDGPYRGFWDAVFLIVSFPDHCSLLPFLCLFLFLDGVSTYYF